MAIDQVCRVCWQSTSTSWGYTPSLPDACSVDGSAPCNLYKRVLEAEKAIEDAQKALFRLVNEHKVLMIQVNEYHDQIQKLPAEITSQIFSFCSPPPVNESEDTGPVSPPEFPLVLGRVCSHWRQIAWSTPELWSTIYILPSSGPTHQRNQISSVVSEWIIRSGSLPLTIKVSMKDGPLEGDAMVRVLRGLSRRWRNLDLRVTGVAASYIFGNGYDAPPQPLQYLGVHIIDCRRYTSSEVGNPSFSLPDADLMQLIGLRCNRNQSALPGTRWLKLYWVTNGNVADFLYHAQNIHTLEIGECPEGKGRLHTIPIVLPYLTTIDILGSFGHPGNSFDYVTFPSLEIMNFSKVPPAYWMRSFLSRNSRIREIGFTGSSGNRDGGRRQLSSDTVRQHLQLFQQIKTLRIERPWRVANCEEYPLVDDQFLDSLSLRSYTSPGSATALPFLISLEHFIYEGQRFFSWHSLLQLFDSEEGKNSARWYLKSLVMKIISRDPNNEPVLMDLNTAHRLHHLGQGMVSISVISALTGEIVFEDLVESSYRAARPNEEIVDDGDCLE